MSSIRQLEEKVVATEIALMRWSDQMDLLALANARGEVSLHRLTWQRVWCLLPENEGSTVVDMTWRPDGKIIAIAYSCGRVVLVEVENKNILRSINIEDEITCIAWEQDTTVSSVRSDSIDKDDKNTKKSGDSSNFLPDLPSLSNEFPSAAKSPLENLIDLNFVKSQNELNILIIGSKSGNLHISMFGLFTCAIVDINNHFNKPCSIVSIHTSENLSILYVTVCDDTNNLHIIIMDTSVISSHSKEFFAMALKHAHLSSLLSYLDSTMSSITEAWESILLEMDSKLSKYASNVPEHTVTADFLDLLMFGIPSDEMEEFLMQDLTDKGLKKLGHSIELSYSNIQKLLLKHLNEVGQNITYHLAELRGMARLTYRNKNLGLNEKTISSALMANGAFLVKGVEVQQVINHSMTNYRAFFRWLYVVILKLMDEQIPPEIPKMTQQDLSYITEFLQNFDCMGNNSSGQTGRFKLERLGQYLLDAPLTNLAKNDSNIWCNFLEGNECVAAHESIIRHYESMSLVQQHKHLIKSIENIFIEPNEFLSQSFKFISLFSCMKITDLKNLSLTQYNCSEFVTFTAIFDKQSSSNGIFFLEVNSFEGLNIKGVCLYSSSVPEIESENSCKILDVKFYSASVISILLEDNSEFKTPYLCQIPVAPIRVNMTDINVTSDTLILEQEVNKINICDIPGNIVKQIESMVATKFAVTSSRHACVVLSDNRRKVQLFEMEADEEEDEFEDTYMTANTTRDENEAMLQDSVTTE